MSDHQGFSLLPHHTIAVLDHYCSASCIVESVPNLWWHVCASQWQVPFTTEVRNKRCTPSRSGENKKCTQADLYFSSAINLVYTVEVWRTQSRAWHANSWRDKPRALRLLVAVLCISAASAVCDAEDVYMVVWELLILYPVSCCVRPALICRQFSRSRSVMTWCILL